MILPDVIAEIAPVLHVNFCHPTLTKRNQLAPEAVSSYSQGLQPGCLTDNRSINAGNNDSRPDLRYKFILRQSNVIVYWQQVRAFGSVFGA